MSSPTRQALTDELQELLGDADEATLSAALLLLRGGRQHSMAKASKGVRLKAFAKAREHCEACGKKASVLPGGTTPFHLRQVVDGSYTAKGSRCKPCQWAARRGKDAADWPFWKQFDAVSGAGKKNGEQAKV